MPKILENVQTDIIAVSRKILLEDGYKALTVRRVAQACGIASGTIYNYYRSKDEIAASVMLEDWNRLLEDAESFFSRTDDCMQCLHEVYSILQRFAGMYQNAWRQYGGTVNVSEHYHDVLISQISNMIRRMFARLGIKSEPPAEDFIAETLLYYSCRNMSFNGICPFIEKIIR